MQPDLASLVGSRICHDLISPIGAISNGVELLSLTDGDTSAEMQLISDSVASANARIRFFRIAYGTAGGDQLVSRTEVLSILSATALGGRFTYFWQLEDDIRRADLRLIFLLFQCFETALPMGGDINVTETGQTWTLIASGPRIAPNEALWETLKMPPPECSELTAAQVHFALAPAALRETGRSIQYHLGDEGITINI